MQYTLNNLISIFQNIANEHEQINAFYCGEIANYRNEERLYPLLYINPSQGQISEREINLDFNILVLDRIDADRSNENEVYSDCLQIIQDIKAYLKNARVYEFRIDEPALIEKVGDEINSDWVCGWKITLRIRADWNADICSIPGLLTNVEIQDGTVINTQSTRYLTCDTLLSCSNFINLLNTKANLSGATFTGNIEVPTLTASTIHAEEIFSDLVEGLNISGDYVFGGLLTGNGANITSLSATTIYSGTTNLSLLIGSGGGGDTVVNSGVDGYSLIEGRTGSTVGLYGLLGEGGNILIDYHSSGVDLEISLSKDIDINNLLVRDNLSATTYYSGTTELSTLFPQSKSFSAGVNLTLTSGLTNIDYALNNDIVINDIISNSGTITNFNATNILTNDISSGTGGFTSLLANNFSADDISCTNLIGSNITASTLINTTTLTAITANTSYLKVNTLSGSSTNPERVIIYDVQPNSYSNVLVGIASAQTYAQLNIRNIHGGNQASSDIVATANNGNESSNYIDMGINSSSFTGYVGSANDAYVYSSGNDLWLGNVTSGKNVKIFNNGTGQTNVKLELISNQGVSATTISASTIFSGTTELSRLFPYDISSHRKSGTGGSMGERYYSTNIINAGTTPLTVSANQYYFMPFIVTRACTIDRLGINVTTSGATTFARLGIYNSSNTNPSTLVLDAGFVSFSGSPGFKTIAVNQALQPALYYLVMVPSTSTGAVTAVSPTTLPAVNGFASGSIATYNGYLTNTTVGYGSALTADTTSITMAFTTTANAPLIYYRLSS